MAILKSVKFLKFIALVVIFSLIDYCKSACKMEQTCTDESAKNCTVPDVPKNNTPFLIPEKDMICQEFKGVPACCNKEQNVLMSKFDIHFIIFYSNRTKF